MKSSTATSAEEENFGKAKMAEEAKPPSWGSIKKKPLPCDKDGSSKAKEDNLDRKQPA